MQVNGPVLQVSEINRYVKGLIQGDPRLRDLWVTGEISNFHHRSGHMYDTVKDSASALRCVFFAAEHALRFKPASGMEVILHGSLSVYDLTGLPTTSARWNRQAWVHFSWPLNSKGEAGTGKASSGRKPKSLFCPALSGGDLAYRAALQDIVGHGKKALAHVRLAVAESSVQGAGAPADIVRALEALNRREDIELMLSPGAEAPLKTCGHLMTRP